MYYILHWKDTFGRQCMIEQPESWENIDPILNAVRRSGHFQKGSFRIEPVEEEGTGQDNV